MIIVLKGADFSAKKLGNVSIPRDSIDETTFGIVSNYTKTINIDKLYAFDDFIIAIKSTGIWEKVSHAYFPFLANSVNEAFYEAKRGISLAEVENAPYVILSAYLIDSYGLKTRAWLSGDGYNVLSPRYTYGVFTNSYHIATLYKKEETGSLFSAGIGSAVSQTINNNRTYQGSQTNGFIADNSGENADYNVMISNGKYPANSANLIQSVLNGSTIQVVNAYGSYANPGTEAKTLQIAANGYGQYGYNTWPVAVQLFGSELTDEEVQIMNTELHRLNGKLIV